MRSVFAMLPPTTQEELLQRINRGPEEAEVVQWLGFIGAAPTPEKTADYAAWGTYLTFCAAYDDMLPLLREQYAQAIARAGQQDREAKRRWDPQQRLGEHRMTYYWRGTNKNWPNSAGGSRAANSTTLEV